jgi:hypothetical protein
VKAATLAGLLVFMALAVREWLRKRRAAKRLDAYRQNVGC